MTRPCATLRRALALASVLAARAGAQEQIGPLTLPEAAACFAAFEEACARDGGKLWGVELRGPVLLVDPITRRLVANEPDAEGALAERDGVFVGTLPREKPIANAPIEWAGKRWAMALVLFLGETEAERVTLLAHESFHLVQQGLGLYVFGEENDHLDTAEGRTWLQLEWKALAETLARAPGERRAALEDALDFRAARHARFPDAAPRETRLELREGLASYTGFRIAGREPAEVVADAARRAKEDNFVRVFAYTSGTLYGYLLDDARPGWRAELGGESDLGALLASAAGIEPSPARAEAAATRYGGDALRAAEAERERARAERLAAWKAALVDGPVLVLDLSLAAPGAVDTRYVFPFDATRTVFTARKLVAKFGTLTVEGGALLEERKTRRGHLSLEGAAQDRLSGPGWTLELAKGWEVVPAEREGDFTLRQTP